MSHFALVVVGENIESQLAPFQENNTGDCPSEFLAFIDVTEEEQKTWRAATREMVQLADGRLESPEKYWRVLDCPPSVQTCKSYELQEFLREMGHTRWSASTREGVRTVSVPYLPKGGAYVQAPVWSLEPFDEWMQKQGYEKDAKTGRYGYWENPNRQWDYWRIGGRWSGFFRLKAGTAGKEQRASSALKDEIDFEHDRDEAARNAGERYDATVALLAAHGAPVLNPEEFQERYPEADYAAQPFIEAFIKHPLLGQFAAWPKDMVEAVQAEGGREAYVANSRMEVGAPYAFLMDGVWYSAGTCHWSASGPVTTSSQAGWAQGYYDMLDTLPGNTRLTLVDCHI